LWPQRQLDSLLEVPSRVSPASPAVAISVSMRKRGELHRIADEQAGLRRVAMLIDESSRERAFRAVTQSLCASRRPIIRYGTLRMRSRRYDSDGAPTRGPSHPRRPSGLRLAGGPIADAAGCQLDYWTQVTRGRRRLFPPGGGARVRSTVGSPIVCRGRPWGLPGRPREAATPSAGRDGSRAFSSSATSSPRLGNAEARTKWPTANEHAALRRVATLVAPHGTEELFPTPRAVFQPSLDAPVGSSSARDRGAVTVGASLRRGLTARNILRSTYPNGRGTLASSPPGLRPPHRACRLLRGGRNDRQPERAAVSDLVVAGPILVDCELGAMCVFFASRHRAPAGTEDRLHDFIEPLRRRSRTTNLRQG